MSSSAVQTAPSAAAPRPFLKTPVGRAVQALASLRLTVVLFALSVVLVFVGTLAQNDLSIWTVVKEYFRSFYVLVPFQVFVRFGQIFFHVPQTVNVPGGFPFPGGWTIGALLLANLTAAHLIRFKLSWKRSGILILHAGVVILLVSELVTGVYAVESRMVIGQGQTVNYIFNAHRCELAVTDPSDPKFDRVVSVLPAALAKGGVVRDDALPFDIQVRKYMANSTVADVPPAGPNNPATDGAGLRMAAVEAPPGAGKNDVDVPSAYLTLRRKGSDEAIGTYLVSLWLGPQHVTVDGKRYDLELRFRREYLPFSLTLIEFRFDRYIGTEVAKNYSSRVRLVDPERGEDREMLIKMNDPLRYGGETFYQADFDKDTERGTVLQVVRNPGWLIPYISCVLVTLGMAVHFGLSLTNFLRRRAA